MPDTGASRTFQMALHDRPDPVPGAMSVRHEILETEQAATIGITAPLVKKAHHPLLVFSVTVDKSLQEPGVPSGSRNELHEFSKLVPWVPLHEDMETMREHGTVQQFTEIGLLPTDRVVEDRGMTLPRPKIMDMGKQFGYSFLYPSILKGIRMPRLPKPIHHVPQKEPVPSIPLILLA